MSKMISLTEDGMVLSSEPLTAQDFLNITLNAQLNLFRNLTKQGAKTEELYDLYNEAASAFLATFAPDRTLRPDLTAEAILKAENELLAAKANKIAHLNPKQQRVEQLKNEAYQSVTQNGNYRKDVGPILIPLDSLDEDGRPKKPIHKQEV